MSALNRDYLDPRNQPYYPVWFAMSDTEKDDRAKYVAARDWAGLLLKYPRNETNWGGWTIPKSSYEFAGFDAEGNKVYGAGFKNRGIPLSLFSYRYVNGKKVYIPFTPEEITEWFTEWARPVPGDEVDPAVTAAHLKNVLAAQASMKSRASNPGDIEVNVPRFGPTFSTSEYLTVKKPKFGQTLIKVAAVVGTSIVGGVVLGKVAGVALAKAGGAVGASSGAISSAATAARTAQVAKSVNTASKVYKAVQTAKKITDDSKQAAKITNQILAAPTFLKTTDQLPDYSPVPGSVNDPAFRDLAIAESMRELAPQMVGMTAEQRAEIQGQVTAEVDAMIARYNASGADLVPPSPSSLLTTDAKAAQADSLQTTFNARNIGIALGVVALIYAVTR